MTTRRLMMFWLLVFKSKKSNTYKLFFTFLLFAYSTFAQNVPVHQPTAYVDSLGNYYQQADLPLYIYVAHTPDGTAHHLKEDKAPKAQPIYLDGHGKHLLKHADGVNHTAQVFAIYADGIAPMSKVTFQNAPSFLNKNSVFYGKGLACSVKAKDEMSGVANIYLSVNGADFVPKNTTDFTNEGEYKLSFFSVDHVGNVEKVNTTSFVVDLTAPSTAYNVVGIAQGNIISTSTKLYLTAEDNASGVAKTFYKLDEGNFMPYVLGTNINFSHLNDGEHTLTFYSVDHVQNQEQAQTFDFYYDKTAPIMSADVLGDRFIANNRVYFSGRTKLKLTAVDNKSGVKAVLYSINGENFKEYNDPFYLPSRQGEHIIRYYALDHMANEGAGNRFMKLDEYRHNVSKVFLDLTGPLLSHDFQGAIFRKGDSIFINKHTQIRLKGTDPESGLQYLSYNFSQADQEIRYQQPFTISEEGVKNIYFYGYDNVNNRNIGSFVIVVDNTAPQISHTFSIAPTADDEKVAVYPSYVSIFLAATDQHVGLSSLTYKLNGGKEMPYQGFIQGFKPKETYKITVFATDKLGNKSEYSFKFKTDKY